MEFLTRDELLSFRTASTLLGYLDIIEKRKVTQLQNHEKSGRKSEVFLYSKPSRFANILVRSNEVIAVIPACETAERVEITAVLEDLYLTRNPRFDEHAKVELDTTPKLKLEIGTSNSTAIPKSKDHDLCDIVVSILPKSKNMSFDDHCANVLTLVKNCHAADTKGEKSVDFHNLCGYVFLFSIQKMMARFTRGTDKNNKNFWRLLDVDFPRKSANDLPKMFTNQPPNEDQKSWFSWAVGSDPALLKLCLEDPVYNRASRERLYRILRQHRVLARDALDKVGMVVKTAQSSEVLSKQQGKDIYRLTFNSVHAMRKLDGFLVSFEGEISKHLEWLAFAHELKRTTIEGKEEYGRTGSRLSPSASPTDQRIASSSRQRETSQELETMTENTDLSAVMEQLDIDDEIIELNDLEFQPGGSWDKAALKYMQLTCLHYVGLKEIGLTGKPPSTADNQLSSFIKKIDLSIVSVVVPEFKDRKMLSINKFLSTFEPDVEKREMIVGWLKSYNRILKLKITGKEGIRLEVNLDKEVFNGNWHCEALLLSLYALMLEHKTKAPDMSFKDLSKTLSTSSLIPPEILARFRNIKSLLMVSRRCCPACNKLVQVIREEQTKASPHTATIYPGYHTLWSGVALPPWLPRKFAQQVVDHAHLILRQRFDALLARIEADRNTRKRSHSFESVEHSQTKRQAVYEDI